MSFEKSRPIVIVPYREAWVSEFEEIKLGLKDCLGELALRIDHIGSTSVPGLSAKDVIDVQITVANVEAELLLSRLMEGGYKLVPDIFYDNFVGISEAQSPQMKKRFSREKEGDRRAHIHIRETGKLNQRYALLFRDYLRASAVTRDGYQVIKERLALLFPESIDGYLYIKDPLMDVIFEGAEQWAVHTGWSQL